MVLYRFPDGQDDQYLTLEIPDSSGGINSRFQAEEIQDNQMTVAYNLDISTPGKKKKRLGNLTVLNDLGAGPILSLIYQKAPSVAARMVLITGKRMYKSTDPTNVTGFWVDIDSTDHFTTDLTTTTGILAGDTLFFSNGTDAVHSYNGTSITDYSTDSTYDNDGVVDPATGTFWIPQGKVLAYFKNRLWVATTTLYPDAIYFSNALDLDAFNASTQIFKVATGDSTAVTNMVPYSESSMVIFKERSIHELVVSGDTASYWNLRPLDSRFGCVAPDCAKFYNNKIYFIAQDGLRVLPIEQNATSYLIKTEVDDINYLYIDRAKMVIFDSKLFVALPTGSSAYPNKVYVLDLNTNGWVIYTGWNVGCWGIYIENGLEVLMYGDSNDGKVYKCFTSTAFNDDAATAINYQEETKSFDFGQPFKYKVGGELELDIASSTGNTVTVSAAIDGGGYTSLGTCTATDKFRLDGLGKFKRIKFKFVSNAAATEQLIFNGFRATTFLEEYQSEV